MAKPPAAARGARRPLRAAPQLRAARRLAERVASNPPDRLVKTHCCFCGQQCGIQLKVRDNQVVGFEPWEEFPFNRGMLCPKGVQALPAERPSRPAARSADAHRRRASAQASWDEALDFTARRLREIQERYGKDAVADLRRRLAHHREGLPARQVRARRARHAAHRLQRPALHGVGGHRLQAGVRRRPLAESLERHPAGRGRASWPARTSPSARRSRPTTSGDAATTAAS